MLFSAGWAKGGWYGALRIAQRQPPLRDETLGELSGHLPSEAEVGKPNIVVLALSAGRVGAMGTGFRSEE